MTKTTKWILIISIIVLLCGFLFGCNGKNKYRSHKDGYDPKCSICKHMSDAERVTWLHDYAILSDTVSHWLDTTAGDIVYANVPGIGLRNCTESNDKNKPENLESTGTIEEVHDTSKYGRIALRGDPPKKSNDVDMSVGYKNGKILVGMSTKPKSEIMLREGFIHTESDGIFNIDTIPTTHYEMVIRDISGTVAFRQNGKWTIKNCNRALEVIYQLDSIKNSEPPREEPESVFKKELLNSNKQ